MSFDTGGYLNQLVTLRKFDEAKAQAALADAGADPAPSLVADAEDAEKLSMDAEGLRTTYTELVGNTDNPNPANRLLSALLAQEDPNTDGLEDDDGRALVDAVADTFETPDSALTTASDNEDRLDVMLQTADDGTETGRIADIESQPSGVGELENVQTDITQNSDDITVLDGSPRTRRIWTQPGWTLTGRKGVSTHSMRTWLPLPVMAPACSTSPTAPMRAAGTMRRRSNITT